MIIFTASDTNLISIADTHFWIGTGDVPSNRGEAIPDESGSLTPLGRYTNQVRTFMCAVAKPLTCHREKIQLLSNLWSDEL